MNGNGSSTHLLLRRVTNIGGFWKDFPPEIKSTWQREKPGPRGVAQSIWVIKDEIETTSNLFMHSKWEGSISPHDHSQSLEIAHILMVSSVWYQMSEILRRHSSPRRSVSKIFFMYKHRFTHSRQYATGVFYVVVPLWRKGVTIWQWFINIASMLYPTPPMTCF